MQASILGFALAMLGLTVILLLFMSVAGAYMDLSSASAWRNQLIAERGREDFTVQWDWSSVNPSQLILVVNNTGEISSRIAFTRLALKTRLDSSDPYYSLLVSDYGVVAGNISLPPAGSTAIPVALNVSKSTLDSMYPNTVLEATIVTERGGVFKYIYDPTPPQSLAWTGFSNTTLIVFTPPGYAPGETLFYNYTGSGVIQGVIVYAYYSRITITRILVDGVQVNNAPVTIGGFGSFTPAQISSVYIPLNKQFNQGVQVYGTSWANYPVTIILVVSKP